MSSIKTTHTEHGTMCRSTWRWTDLVRWNWTSKSNFSLVWGVLPIRLSGGFPAVGVDEGSMHICFGMWVAEDAARLEITDCGDGDGGSRRRSDGLRTRG